MNSYNVVLRIVYDILLGACIVLMPAYVVVVLGVVGLFLFRSYVEGVLALLVLDGLYGFAGSIPRSGLYTVIGVISYVIVQYLRKHLTWYQ